MEIDKLNRSETGGDMKEITDRQQEIVNFIGDYIKKHTYSPSVRDIARHFEISPKGAHDHITALKRKGFLASAACTPRTIEILSIDDNPLGFIDVPILGDIAAGTPIFAEENFEGVMTMHRSMLKKGSAYFALRIKGDSMEGAGIFEDDIAIIEKQEMARNGEITAVQIDDADSAAATLKRFFLENNRVCLQSENPKYAPRYYYQDIRVLGRLATIIRSY
jgi:repressor LexA